MDQHLSRRSLLLCGATALVVVSCGNKESSGKPDPTVSDSSVAATSSGPSTTAVVGESSVSSSAPAALDNGFNIRGLTPFITPNKRFFQIDITVEPPEVHADTWELAIGGMVDRPKTYTFNDLRARPQVERTDRKSTRLNSSHT